MLTTWQQLQPLGDQALNNRAVLPPSHELAKVDEERADKYIRIFDAGYELFDYGRIGYDVHVVVEKEKHKTHILVTAMGKDFTQPIGLGDSFLQGAFYYHLREHPFRGCYGSRIEKLPETLLHAPNCHDGVPYRELRLGEHNPGGQANIMVIPEARKRGVARNIAAFSLEVAIKKGVKFGVLSTGKYEDIEAMRVRM